MQKYRADISEIQKDGSIAWFAKWMGGPSLARINNCRLYLTGDPRATVYATDEPNTYFSQPAMCSYKGVRMKGYLTSDSGGFVFHPICC